MRRYRLYQTLAHFGRLGGLIWELYDKLSPAVEPPSPGGWSGVRLINAGEGAVLRSIPFKAEVRIVCQNSRFADGAIHLEMVRLVALGHRHLALDLGDVPLLGDDGVSDIVSWFRVLAFKGGRLRLLNVGPASADKLRLALKGGRLSLLNLGPTSVDKLRPTNASAALEDESARVEDEPDWSLASGYMSLGAWARMRRKQS